MLSILVEKYPKNASNKTDNKNDQYDKDMSSVMVGWSP